MCSPYHPIHHFPFSFVSLSLSFIFPLVVEETDVLLHEGDAQFLGCLKDGTVVLAASWGGDVLDTGTSCAEHVVDEWELYGGLVTEAECVA